MNVEAGPSEMTAVAQASAEIDAAARALVERWRGGDQGDFAFRTACGGALAELRGAFRRSPGAFSPATVALLRDVGQALAARGDASPRRGAGSLREGIPLPLRLAPRAPAGPPPIEVLRDVFGYPSFRAGQLEIIEALLAGRDCVGIMPTGAGKSLTFQIPARILGGVTLVVCRSSP
jgi:ATP-dependent DNA helicase RecQ